MNNEIYFHVLPKKIQPKQRPRVLKTGRSYTPKETVAAEKEVQDAFMSFKSAMIIEGVDIANLMEQPVFLRVAFYIPLPKSRAKETSRFHLQRPDLDNLVKLVKDALNGLAWKDDSQVWKIECKKYWTACEDKPRIIVDISYGEEEYYEQL